MKKIKAAIAAGALVVAAGMTGVLASSSASADVTGWERIEQQGTIPSGDGTYDLEAYCTSGKKVLGGGWLAATSQFQAASTRVVRSYPTGSGSGWSVQFTETSGQSVGVAVFAICGTTS